MRLQALLLLNLVLIAPPRCNGQDAAGQSQDASSTEKSPQDRDVSLKLILPNALHDQKRIFLFPLSAARGHHLKPVLSVVGITAALIAVEESNNQAFKRTASFDGFNRVFSGSHTSLGMEVFPAAFYLVSLAKKNDYAQKTFWLAGEAVLDSAILTTVMKDIDRRLRPRDVSQNSSNTWFKYGHGDYLTGVGSFPSGHTITAFSLATVFARRYPNPRWHVWVAYGLATLVGFSRVPLQSHFPSDVFAGGALGCTITRYVVLGK